MGRILRDVEAAEAGELSVQELWTAAEKAGAVAARLRSTVLSGEGLQDEATKVEALASKLASKLEEAHELVMVW